MILDEIILLIKYLLIFHTDNVGFLATTTLGRCGAVARTGAEGRAAQRARMFLLFFFFAQSPCPLFSTLSVSISNSRSSVHFNKKR